MERNIDRLNDAYSLLFILYIVLKILDILYNKLTPTLMSADVALLFTLIIGFSLIRWLFRKSK